MDRRIIILSLSALAIGAALAFALVSSPGRQPLRTTTSGTALIGGAFTLTDHHGKQTTEKMLLGKYSLVFFGFTYCPDVCPVAMQNVSAALDLMGTDADKIRPIFITTDPERDTVEKVAQFVSSFHKNTIGLTGTVEQIKAASKAYRVYSAKKKNADMPDGYTIDHASIIYFMGPDGKYVTHFNHSTPPNVMASRIKLIFEQME